MTQQPKLQDFTTLEAFCEAKKAHDMAEYGRSPEFNDVAWYNESGVYTIEDAIKWDLYSTISDVSKDANGFRARFNWQTMTIAELEADLEYYYKAANETYEREVKWEKRATIAWKAHLRHLVSIGAGNIQTALKWDMAAEDADMDPGMYCYQKGISYRKERLITRVLKAA
jgi:hypothetical protein